METLLDILQIPTVISLFISIITLVIDWYINGGKTMTLIIKTSWLITLILICISGIVVFLIGNPLIESFFN